jgi:hypothetical protein
MRILVLIAALFALQPAMAAAGLPSHGDTMGDCQKGGGKGAPAHGDCPR